MPKMCLFVCGYSGQPIVSVTSFGSLATCLYVKPRLKMYARKKWWLHSSRQNKIKQEKNVGKESMPYV